jgi:CBS domain-containing protein
VASIDPASYLRSLAPFDALPEVRFAEVARAVDVAFHPSGVALARAGGEPLRHLWVVRKGAVRLEREGRTIQVLEEGELFGYTSLVSGEATLDVVVDDDLVAYRIPGAVFTALLSDPAFAGHFTAGLGERFRASLRPFPGGTLRVDLMMAVERLVRRPARWVEAGATVQDAARAMREDGISSVLVRSDPPGIVTDRDLRNRVLAEDLGPEEPVARIASRPLLTVAATAPVYEAWRALLDAEVHHLAVERGGEVAGVVTTGDILKQSARGPVALLRRVERYAGRAELAAYAPQVADMVAALVASGLEAAVIGGFVARLNDVLTHRLLRWAEAELGPPPAPYAWVAFGSDARREQTLLTDQDNFLVYADDGARERAWFQALGERVNSDLEAAGFPACPGGHMARNEHGTLSEWRRRLDACADEPRPHEAELYFDLRRVGGHLALDALEAPIARAGTSPMFLHLLAREALAFSPPGELVLRLRRSPEVDLKLHGVAPVVFLARCYALEAGSSARGTLERLEAARAAGLLGVDTFVAISEAFRFVTALRLRVQLRALDRGEAPSNRVALASLAMAERARLKEAFRAVKAWQVQAAQRYHVTD